MISKGGPPLAKNLSWLFGIDIGLQKDYYHVLCHLKLTRCQKLVAGEILHVCANYASLRESKKCMMSFTGSPKSNCNFSEHFKGDSIAQTAFIL